MNPKVSVIIPVYNVEAYIKEMLLSVQGQSFNDFEVILVNDGSTDGSQQIINEFCARDKRFRCFVQENAGVAAARNLGIEKATGKYIVFYDPDDIVPVKALEKMVKAAVKNNAEMIIGVMQESDLGERKIYMNSQKLAKEKSISPAEPRFFRAWSLCNKMFSRKFLEDNNLRMDNVFHSEDGVFTFKALNCANNITGCDAVAYQYVKRPFWMAASATQKMTVKYLNELFRAHDIMIEEAEKLAHKHVEPDERKTYLSELYVRLISNDIINVFYRSLWKTEEGVVDSLLKRLELYKTHISDSQWKGIVKTNKDIELDNGLMTQDEMAERPLVSVVISPKLECKEIEYTLGGLYNQSFPRFEVLLGEKAYTSLDFIYSGMANIKNYETDGKDSWQASGLKKSRGRYLMFLSEPLILTKNTLQSMEKKISRKNGPDFASVLVKKYDGQTYSSIPEMNMIYGYSSRGRKRYNALADCDIFLSNKLIKKEALEGIYLTGDGAEISKELYRTKKFERIRKNPMIVTASTWKKLSSKCEKPSALRMSFNNKKNTFIDKAVENIKRYITREDIDKVKSVLKRGK